MKRLIVGAIVCVFLAAGIETRADSPCISGVQVGQRPMPYAFVVLTGKQRGQPTCYICETADSPAVIVFARNHSKEVGELVAAIDQAVGDAANAPLRGWVTFLGEDHTKLDSQIVEWGKKHALKNMPLGVFEDIDGPPAYRLHSDADATVLLFVKQKVVANFAFRSGEMTPKAREEVVKAIPKVLKK